ncbi:integrase [Chimaeribacter californicus]|uniref:Integrase n=1 Tax=Chimaeribacter californicus TaxID=2060067 RepID=A0A2N5E2V2_9GAMM|nr:site-specific integrase [Chimaeribacter californicus]PLR35020.1 integrase [Chimaeribacter californicus]
MENITFDDLLDHYFHVKLLRPATQWSYRKVVKSFIKDMKKQPWEVDSQTVLAWRREVLTGQRLEARTWNNKVAHMRAIFNFGINEGVLTHKKNPFNGVVVRAGKKKKKTLTKGQIEAIYLLMQQYYEQEQQLAQSHRRSSKCALYPAWFWMTVLDMLRYTAIRQNQLQHIRVGDVNLEERWVDLRTEGAKNHCEHRVPVIRALYPRLHELVTRSLEAGAELTDPLFDVARFDVRRRKSAMSIYPLRAFFRRLSKDCRFPVSPHRFRHTVATHMMKSPDRNIQAVKRLLGHVSIMSTMEYIDEDVDALREILEQELM